VNEADHGFAIKLTALAKAPLVQEKVRPHLGWMVENPLEGILGGVELVGPKWTYQV
jgi:hypothetical protein